MLLLAIWSSAAPLYLAFSDLERPNSRSLKFRVDISRKGADLDHILLLNTNRKTYGESNGTIIFEFNLGDPEKSTSRSLRLRRHASQRSPVRSHVTVKDQ